MQPLSDAGFLLDTNAISEGRRRAPNVAVAFNPNGLAIERLSIERVVTRREPTDVEVAGSVGRCARCRKACSVASAMQPYLITLGKGLRVVPALVEAEVAALAAATSARHSYALAPDRIALLSRSMWSGSKIALQDGEKLVVWAPGFAGPFRERVRAWAQAHGVKTKGM